MNILENQLCKSVIATNLLDMDYDEFISFIDLSLDLMFGDTAWLN